MSTWSRATRVALSLTLALCVPVATGCSSNDATDDQSAPAIEKEEDVVLQDDDVQVVDVEDDGTDADATTQDDSAAQSESSGQTQRVGADGVGFVEVPLTWTKFEDIDGNNSIQWCDGTPYTIISLNVFDLSTVPEDQRSSFTAEDAANSVWANILNAGVEEDAVTGARVTLAGRDALQVYALYPDGTYLVSWTLEDDDGGIRYVAAEGTETTIMGAVDIVQNTYSL